MKPLFVIQDEMFYKEDFLDDITEYDDIIPIIQERAALIKLDTIECTDLNDCCEKTKSNLYGDIVGYIDEEENFIFQEEIEEYRKQYGEKFLNLYVIRIYKCLNCKKWIIDIME
ncbi:hypothetical protein [Clostridium sp. C8-1-8]|uniref:hypothetical protein n=1 Tax=Clostridium sp. C8-1-8 TaxID=2698831 RepID=UPI00136E07C0|nr:hypothetical protein [Clostridium sp. C8-1-8]